MIQVAYVQAQTYYGSCRTDSRSLEEMRHLLLAYGVHEIGNHHEEDNEHIIVCHLHMVGIYLECSEERRDEESPQVFPPVGKHYTADHRRQIRKRHHLPQVSGGDDDKEIAGERPYHRTEGCKIRFEVERAQHDIEAQQIDEKEPHVLGQSEMVDVNHVGESRKTLVARRNLIGRHSAEHGTRPAGHLARPVVVFRRFESHTPAGRRIVAVEHLAVDVGRKEIGERDNCKEQYCQDVRQILFPVFHYSYNCFIFVLNHICLQN